MIGNCDGLAGFARGAGTAESPRERGAFSTRNARRLVHPFPSPSSLPAAPRADRIMSFADVSFARGRSFADGSCFARPPLCRAFETAIGRPSGTRPSAFAVSPAAGDAPPRMQGEPLEELRWVRSQRNESRSRTNGSQPKGQES
jgi:hypothetical protein